MNPMSSITRIDNVNVSTASSSSSSSCCRPHAKLKDSNQLEDRLNHRHDVFVALFGCYMFFGAIHEVSHLFMALYFRPNHAMLLQTTDEGSMASTASTTATSTAAAVSAAALAGGDQHDGIMSSSHPSSLVSLLVSIFIQRQCPISLLGGSAVVDWSTTELFWIRHIGWIVSVIVAVFTYLFMSRRRRRTLKMNGIHKIDCDWILVATALVTAIEAMSTDLFGLDMLLLPWNSSSMNSRYHHQGSDSSSSNVAYFYCGNFGVILLHHLWYTTTTNNNKTRNNNESSCEVSDSGGGTPALDVLQRMIQVTMMRGAQSGGVVTFQPPPQPALLGKSQSNSTTKIEKKKLEWKGIRCRVVNKKRTDLSVLVRNKVQKEVFNKKKYGKGPSNAGLRNCGGNNNNTVVPILAGHTRFATSSKATFDGTHPHRWCPPSKRRMYNLSIVASSPPSTSTHPNVIHVENYITHNGDFDYYKVNNKMYDVQTIQKWLVYVTRCPMPASVDSCAIAGMMDLLHTQGCFGLSIRYAVCFFSGGSAGGSQGRSGKGTSSSVAAPTKQSSSSILDDIDNESNLDSYPEYDHFERLGSIFEDALAEMLVETAKTAPLGEGDDEMKNPNTIQDVGDSQYDRHSFALRVVKKLRESTEEYQKLIGPIEHHLDLGGGSREATSVTDGSAPPKIEAHEASEGHEGSIRGLEYKNDHNNSVASLLVTMNAEGSMLDSSTLVIEEGKQYENVLGSSTDLCNQGAHYRHHETDEENGCNGILLSFCRMAIDAFFDNDLFQSTKTFMENAKGSFGLVVASSVDADRQICMAARGQTMSVAFYPSKGLICYGSEQAAVKAGMSFPFPGKSDALGQSQGDIDNDALRLDLDDLGGEILVLDWGKVKYGTDSNVVSYPNRNLMEHEMMNGRVTAILYQESKSTTQDPQIYHRMTRLTRNRLIRPLRPESADLIQSDLHDIPNICKSIQDGWHSNQAGISLNRLTAFNLSRCLRKRLETHVTGALHPQSIDILLTGCEVSLWLAEQFASDLQKSFPGLRVNAVSSNKLLGLYGQDVAVPSLGFPYATNSSHSLHDAIVIIVSHSGGTFAPLSCTNLLQSTTRNIFVVTSEWDTQIGKQLRAMERVEDGDDLFNSRIFSTGVGIRPAEPCSISVVATHQLLTNLFEYICAVILSDHRFRAATDAIVTEQDLKVLERCNRLNVGALSTIVGANSDGYPLDIASRTEKELRETGDLWADHVLENAKAYIMSIVYIFVTVTIGYPLFSAIATLAGLDMASSEWAYLIRAVDALFYIWLPQINITILRLFQGRDLLHRMVGRTVVIGDIPWVAQAAEAFLSKIFACSYSIAGLNVLSGNPSDHFVHRHTHRVVRGSLVICGRPDGRLSALSTAEAAVCLSVNQASSIQSIGGTCESITIGHNPFKLELTKRGIFLGRHRPLFLCERMLGEEDMKNERKDAEPCTPSSREKGPRRTTTSPKSTPWNPFTSLYSRHHRDVLDSSVHSLDASIRPRVSKRRSAAALLGAYLNIEESENAVHWNKTDGADEHDPDEKATVDDVVIKAIKQRKWSDKVRRLFQSLDLDKNGFLSEDDFVMGASSVFPSLSVEGAKAMFHAHVDGTGHLDYDEFVRLFNSNMSNLEQTMKLPPSNRDSRGNIQIEASDEKYFGETLRKLNTGKSTKGEMDFKLARSQHFSQELYETRIASLQRFVSMTVMFHQMGKRVQEFFRRISFGLLGYRMDRTHSIMRIATTASPISGADVRQQMTNLMLLKKVQHSIHVISCAYLQYKRKKEVKRVQQLEEKVKNNNASATASSASAVTANPATANNATCASNLDET